VFAGNGIYLLAAFLVTALVLAVYAWSLTSRSRDARRAAERAEREQGD
jgi:hypothetical protein